MRRHTDSRGRRTVDFDYGEWVRPGEVAHAFVENAEAAFRAREAAFWQDYAVFPAWDRKVKSLDTGADGLYDWGKANGYLNLFPGTPGGEAESEFEGRELLARALATLNSGAPGTHVICRNDGHRYTLRGDSEARLKYFASQEEAQPTPS